MGWIRRPPHPSIGDQLNDELISNGALSVTSSLSLTGSQYFIFAAKILPQWAQMESLTSHMVKSTSAHACSEQLLNTIVILHQYDEFQIS